MQSHSAWTAGPASLTGVFPGLTLLGRAAGHPACPDVTPVCTNPQVPTCAPADGRACCVPGCYPLGTTPQVPTWSLTGVRVVWAEGLMLL